MKVIINKKEINLEIADTFWKKFKGLMFKKNIDYCLRLKTNSIHTFFMKEEIDVVMTNQNNQVLYYTRSVKKNQIIIKPHAYYVYEFPTNFLENLKINDFLKIKE